MPLHPDPAGTTLIELLVVLTLIGIVTTMAVPSMSAYLDRSRVSGALGRLTSDLYQARTFAVREGTRMQLRFVPKAGCATHYEVVRMDREEVIRSVTIPGGARRVCLSSNVARGFSIDSRGMLMGSARRVFASSGEQRDSLVISLVGRVLRSR